MIVEQRADVGVLEVPFGLDAALVQQFFGERAQFVVQPFGHRYPEALFLALDDFRGKQTLDRLPEDVLSGETAELLIDGEALDDVDQPSVQKRHAHFER